MNLHQAIGTLGERGKRRKERRLKYIGVKREREGEREGGRERKEETREERG